jgi:hypothetical protein
VTGRELPPPPDRSDGGLLLAVALMVVVCPAALPAWLGTVLARRAWLEWWLWPVPLLFVMAAVAWRGPLLRAYGSLAADLVALGGLRPGWAVLEAAAVLLARSALLTSPVGVPVGVLAGFLTPVDDPPPTPAPPAPARQVDREDVQRSPYLALPLRSEPPGDLPASWRSGRYLVLPDAEAALARLVIGRPGRGKSVYLQRESYLAGRVARRLTVLDCKGEPGFAAAILDAYAQGWADGGHPGRPVVHLWPQEPLNGWVGGPVAITNRLLSCWEWDRHNAWYREIAVMALRLALHAPGAPVASSGDLTWRMQPGVLARLWEEHPDEAALVRSLGKDLDGVLLRVANLMASLGATLDGARPLGTADCTVLSLPVAAVEHDAAAILRVAMADLAHHVTVRKRPGAAEQIIVDEFSAVPGGRGHAIHLAERGRSAGVAVVLAVQSRRGLGDEVEADRLVGAAGVVVLFATAEPEDIIRLAGTRRLAEHTSSTLTGDGTSYTTSLVWRDQVDGNVVRALGAGQAFILSGGRAQLCQVIRAPGGAGPPAGGTLHPPAPGRAVEGRELPPPVQPRQGATPAARRPPGDLDPAGRPSVRRDRPLRAVADSPTVDRDNQ